MVLTAATEVGATEAFARDFFKGFVAMGWRTERGLQVDGSNVRNVLGKFWASRRDDSRCFGSAAGAAGGSADPTRYVEEGYVWN